MDVPLQLTRQPRRAPLRPPTRKVTVHAAPHGLFRDAINPSMGAAGKTSCFARPERMPSDPARAVANIRGRVSNWYAHLHGMADLLLAFMEVVPVVTPHTPRSLPGGTRDGTLHESDGLDQVICFEA